MKPIQAGTALAATLIVFYSLCTAVAVMFPQAFGAFVNALFHGMDFGRLAGGPPYTWSQFLYATMVFAAWGFAVGAFFAWMLKLLAPR